MRWASRSTTSPASSSPRMPAIIYLHGFTGCRDSHLDVRMGLADLGFLVVSFDASRHGERGQLPDLWNSCRKRVSPDLRSRARRDLRRHAARGPCPSGGPAHRRGADRPRRRLHGRDGLPDDGPPLRRPQGGCGSGGHCGSPAMDRRDDGPFAVRLRHGADRWGAADAPARRYDAIHHIDRFAPIPLLLVHGGRDEIVPPRGQRVLAEKLAPFYSGQPSRLRFSLYPELAHETSPALLEEVHRWLCEFL